MHQIIQNIKIVPQNTYLIFKRFFGGERFTGLDRNIGHIFVSKGIFAFGLYQPRICEILDTIPLRRPDR